ncbi:MAG: Haloacid dehalogenase-like hydrolase domain-containing protein [Planctomycetota bacterium]|nr:MAG: Haloacid dehalogenase-like hydrolase domain-containing protein [Planctomycetota bacterium]
MKSPSLDWLFLDAGNTLVHLDFVRVAEILRAETGFDGDPALMESAEPHARLHVDGARLDADGERKRWHAYFWTILSAAGWLDRALIPDALRTLFRVNQTFTLWSRPGRGAEETLRNLKNLGYRLAVISNSDGSVEGMLDRLGLKAHLEFVIDSKIVGIEKPDPRIFRMALQQSGADPARALYVGDMFHIDVLGARSVGMDAVLMDPADLHTERKCRRVREISELPAILTP